MLTNEQMIAGRFAKLARGRRLLARMEACWNAGGFVRVGTATRYTDYKAKHREFIKLGKSGSIYWTGSKRPVCLDFCSFQFSA
ncbi:hypothetical protein [Rhizobium phage RHph_X2_26]|nr:hypothetical protein [Rhizobium phage RHph_X2_26]